MFASLVIVFPTLHEGGALLLRHKGKEWTFDSGKILAAQDDGTHSIAYVAFYNDVDHEVELVSSGYRLTLTYNLSFAVEPDPSAISVTMPVDHNFEKALTKLLEDPTFLPAGGTLGFGFRHEYPVSAGGRSDGIVQTKTDLVELSRCLKGWDALVLHVFRRLSLKADIRVIYKTDAALIMCNDVYDLSDYEFGENTESEERALTTWLGGKMIQLDPDYEDYGYVVDKEVTWVTELTAFTTAHTTYAAYGNEPAYVRHMLGNLCLVVEVGPPGNRVIPVKEEATVGNEVDSVDETVPLAHNAESGEGRGLPLM